MSRQPTQDATERDGLLVHMADGQIVAEPANLRQDNPDVELEAGKTLLIGPAGTLDDVPESSPDLKSGTDHTDSAQAGLLDGDGKKERDTEGETPETGEVIGKDGVAVEDTPDGVRKANGDAKDGPEDLMS